MKQLQTKRNRGVILTLKGWHKLQFAKTNAELDENAGNCFTVEELSDRMALALHTVSKIIRRLEAVDKSSLQKAFSAFGLELCGSDYTKRASKIEETEQRRTHSQQDWGEAPDVSMFYNRSSELYKLRRWILEERCRLVALLGIGGIGKSTLAVKLGLQLQAEFEVIIWRSLQNAPSVEDTLTSILQFLHWSLRQEITIPKSFNGKLSKLIEFLSSNRCLLILDNAETILFSGGRAGQYRSGYEGYGQLIKTVGEVSHNSCIILASREKPAEITLLEGETTIVKSLQIKGLDLTEIQQLFQEKGQFIGTEREWNALIQHYGGNPLALKMVAAITQELFNAKIASVLKYLEQGLLILEDIRKLLESQFCRLSALEEKVMYWLAINQEPVSLGELIEDMVISSCQSHLPSVIKSLLQRSLIEKSGENLFLQPVVMEYTIQRLLDQVRIKLTEGLNPANFNKLS